MNGARARGRKTNAQFASVLCVSRSHESGRFFVPHRDEADFVLPLAQSLDDRIDAVSDDTEDKLNVPAD